MPKSLIDLGCFLFGHKPVNVEWRGIKNYDWRCSRCERFRCEYQRFKTIPQWYKSLHLFPIVRRCTICNRIEYIFGIQSPFHKQCW